METLAIVAVIGLVLYLHNQKATPAASSPTSATAVPTTTAAQSGAMFPGTPILTPGPVSAGYQIQAALTRLAGPLNAPITGATLPSTISYTLPPAPPPVLRVPPAGIGGPIGSGSRPLTNPIRSGISAGTGTTAVATTALQLLPRTGVIG